MYHKVPIKLSPDQAVLGAVREGRISYFGDLNLMGTVVELDLIIMQQEGLCRPTAIFKGLNRPLKVPADPDWYDEAGVLAVVCKPDSGAELLDGKPSRCAVPADSVFVAYFRPIYDQGQKAQIRRCLQSDHRSVYLLSYWEWVTCHTGNPDLPADHGTRFRERLPWP